MRKKRSLTFFLIFLFIVGTLPITNPVSADGEVDNWPENDAWLRIELISWSANESVEWDNDGGLPDPIFKICVESDGDNLDCIYTPTWDDQISLNNSWNYSMDIPDNSNILNISIECEDNDALNDDECDMNSDVNYWRLYAEYNWSATPSLTISGDGDDDDDVTWKNAASTWKFTIGAFGDSDADGVSDEDDQCEGHDDSDDFDGDGEPSGCDTDDDNDGTPDGDDGCPNPPLGAIVDWGCPMDTDEDGVYDGLDDCPNSNGDAGVDSNGCDLDTDGDGLPDWDDLCPDTPEGEEINLDDTDYYGCSSSQIDSDGDGVKDNLDTCPDSVGDAGVDDNGCDLDTDGDGVPNFDDECANTPQGATVDYMGCPSDLDDDGVLDGIDECPSTPLGASVENNGCSLDLDGDGVTNARDQCPGTSAGAEVSYYGCSASQGDEDLDGVMNVNDECPESWFVDKNNPPETSNGCDGLLESQDDDDDGDGLVNSYDKCPDSPSGKSVDDEGCTSAQRDALANGVSSDSDFGGAIMGMLCLFGIIWLVFSVSTKGKKKKGQTPVYVQVPQRAVPQQSVQQQQQVMREIENQRRDAEQQVAELQKQLHQSNQMSAAQLASVQSQLSDMQQQVEATNMAKADMQKELELMKAQEVERNTLTDSQVNIQDSVVGGDSLIGSTKIENQTVNDADAIAKAAAAAAVDAYRRGLNDREH